jgi:hypothetical protein
MHVEFITDHDTEDAFFDWCARRRRDLIPSWVVLGIVAVVAGCDYVLWGDEAKLSTAVLVALGAQLMALLIAVIARRPHRAASFSFPHAEMASVSLLAVSFVVAFEHRTSILAFMLIAVSVAAAAALGVHAYRGFGFVDRFAEHEARVVHVHLDDDGLDVHVRLSTQRRHIPWNTVRAVGLDDQSLFVVAGWTPVLIPRRAFLTRDAWEQFTQVTLHYGSALKSQKRAPIWRHVRSSKARGA